MREQAVNAVGGSAYLRHDLGHIQIMRTCPPVLSGPHAPMISPPPRPILRSAILAAGTGAPVLLLHGSASSAAMWTPVIDALKHRFRLLAPDLIGYGRTDPWP